MRHLRPALLVLLLSAAGLGVPGSFAHGATGGKAPAKKKTTAATPTAKNASTKAGAKSATAKSASAKSSSAKPGANKSTSKNTATKTTTAKSSTKASSAAPSSNKVTATKTSGKGTAKKTTSKRTRKQPGQKAPTSDRVNEIQMALAKDGSYSGSPNGKWDDDTSAALRKFQSAHGLTPTGKLDAPSLQKLGLGSPTSGMAAPTPPPGSVSRLSSANSFSMLSADSPRQP